MKYYSMIAYNGANYSNVRPRFSRTTLVHAPSFDKSICAYNCVLEEDENASGTLSFSIARDNPSISYIKAGAIIEVRESDSEVYADSIFEYLIDCGKTIWIGRIINLTIDMYGNKSCTCEGMLGFLRDLPLIKYAMNVNNMSLAEFISSVLISEGVYYNLTEHSYTTDSYGNTIFNPDYIYPECFKIKSVICDDRINKMNTYISYMTDYFEQVPNVSYDWYRYKGNNTTAFDFLSNVFDGFGQPKAEGYPYDDQFLYIHMEIIQPEEDPSYTSYTLEPRMAGFRLVIGLDSPRRWGYPTGNNRLIFGESITAASITYDFSNTITSIRFIGGETTEYGMKTVPYVDEDTWYNPRANVSSGVLDSTNGSISEWGIIPGFIEKSNITSKGSLNIFANMYRNIAANPVSKFVATGVDLSYEYSYFMQIKLGLYYEVRFPGQDYDNNVIGEANYYYRCIRRKLNLLNPGQNEYEFSRIIGVMTNGVSAMNANTYNSVQSQTEMKALQQQVEDLTNELQTIKESMALEKDVPSTETDNNTEEEIL